MKDFSPPIASKVDQVDPVTELKTTIVVALTAFLISLAIVYFAYPDETPAQNNAIHIDEMEVTYE